MNPLTFLEEAKKKSQLKLTEFNIFWDYENVSPDEFW